MLMGIGRKTRRSLESSHEWRCVVRSRTAAGLGSGLWWERFKK